MEKQLADCFQDTMNFISCNEILRKQTEYSIRHTTVYNEKYSPTSTLLLSSKQAEIIVEENTAFASALKHRKYYDNMGNRLLGKTAVLNFSNPINPGGGVVNGAMAQEECLCRSSNLYPCLTSQVAVKNYYDYHRNYCNYFFSDRVIYSSNVTVFKTDDDLPQLMEQKDWFQVDVITCAAPYIKQRKYTNKAALFDLFESRIQNIFDVARENNVDILILGAFGCGAFGNPPDIVAKAFHHICNKYKQYFTKIVFSIKRSVRDQESFCPNIHAFQFEFDHFSRECYKMGSTLSEPLYFNTVYKSPVNVMVDEEIKIGDVIKLKNTDRIVEVKKRNLFICGQYYFEYGGSYVLNHKKYENQLVLFFQSNVERILRKADKHPRMKYVNNTIEPKMFDIYKNKQFSILGDSVSTLEGYNPGGYNVFYRDEVCQRANVRNMEDTWWGKVIQFCGGELLVNNSWSGSRVTKLPNTDCLFPSGCSNERTGGLHIGKIQPDVIIVYLGTNDWAYGAKTEGENQEEYFAFAYAKMLYKIKSNYPRAEIWCCTLNTTYMSGNPSFVFPYAFAGVYMETYNTIIREMAHRYACRLVDLYSFHIPYDSLDGSHPTDEGMRTLAALILRAVAKEQD